MKRVDPFFTLPADFESPTERLIRQERALLDSFNAAAESPIERMIRRQNAVMASLVGPGSAMRAFDGLQATIDKMVAVGRVFGDLETHHSIFEKIQQSMSWFDHIEKQMSATSALQRHIDSMMAAEKQLKAIADPVTSAVEAFKKHDEAIKALMVRPEIEVTFSRLAKQMAAAMPVWGAGVGFERYARLAAEIESMAPAVFADLTPEDVTTPNSGKELENECKEVVDVLMAADGDYFQILGKLSKPGSKIRKAVRVLAVLYFLWQFCGTLVAGFNWVSKFLGKKRGGGFARSRVVNRHCVVTPYRLNVRAQPNMKGRVIGVLAKGQVVRVIFKNRHWASVIINDPTQKANISGFVGGKYLKPAKQKGGLKGG